MTKFVLLRRLAPALCAAVLAMSAAQVAAAQETVIKVGYVSLERILRESIPAKVAKDKLETEFSTRQKDLQEMSARLKPLYDYLEKNSAVMSETERATRQKELADQEKEFQRRQREYNEDLNQRKNEELATVVDRANRVVKQIAEAEKYDLIFQEAVYVNPRVDITDKVIKTLNSQTGSGAAPAATPSK